MIAIAGLQFGTAPVSAGNDSPAKRGSAGAGHREVRGAAAGSVIAGYFFSGRDRPPGCQGVRVGPPQVRVAAVVPVAGRLARSQDEASVLADGDRVHVRMIGSLSGIGEDLLVVLCRSRGGRPVRETIVPGPISAQAKSPSWAIGDSLISTSGCSQHSSSGSCGPQSTSQSMRLISALVAQRRPSAVRLSCP